MTSCDAVAVEQAAHAVRAVGLHHRVAHDAVPAGAVLAVREDADREHAPEAVHAVHRDGADGVVDAACLEEEHGCTTTSTPAIAPIIAAAHGIDERARRGDRDQTGEHAVAEHRRVGLQALQPAA